MERDLKKLHGHCLPGIKLILINRFNPVLLRNGGSSAVTQAAATAIINSCWHITTGR